MGMYEKLMTCLASIREKTDFQPEIGLVLGSGLGEFAEYIKIEKIVEYKEIEGFPVSTVEGHKGRFVFGYVAEKPVVIMQGRVHYYEGYKMEDVVLPTRLMGMLGIKKLVLTNASGGVNYDFLPGDFMLMTDHISIGIPNPLIGSNIDKLGERFPDMSRVYNEELQDVIRTSAKECGINLKEGVYLQLTGPSYETAAEIRVFRNWGVDAIGMSTVCEAIAAHQMGIKVCGISCVTALSAEMAQEPLTHEEVQLVADRMASSFKELITKVVSKM